MRRHHGAVVVVAMLALTGSPAWPGGGEVRVRDGFFGVSGIFPDKSLLGELGVDCAVYGFYLGPNSVPGPDTRDTRQMRDLVAQGVTPIPAFFAPSVDPAVAPRVAEIVRYYTTGEGVTHVGIPIRYWQIGNEPNWGWGTSCPPDEFARRVGIIAPGIRAACPDCVILMGGLLDGPEMGDLALEPYLGRFLDAGGGEWIDVYNFHYYGLAWKTGPAVQFYRTGADILHRMRAVLDRFGYGDRPIWVSETSTFSGQMGDLLQTEEEQAADLVKRFVLLWQLGVEKVFWTYVTEPKYEGTGEGFFDQAGLVYDGFGPEDRGAGVKKKAFYAYQHLIARLRGAVPAGTQTDQGVTVARFIVEADTVVVLWQDPWERQGPLWIRADKRIQVGDIYGTPLFEFEGIRSLNLGIEPVYLVGESIEILLHAPPLSPSG